MSILKKLFSFDEDIFYKEFIAALQKEVLDGNETLLDVGCGMNSPIQTFTHKLKHTVGVDLFPQAIEESKKRNLHNEYHQMDVLDIHTKFGDKSFDCVLACDLLEHLTPGDGKKLLEAMGKVARKKIIIYTPNGFVPQHEYDGNEHQIHLSGWSAQTMQALGYKVLGMSGPKILRGEQSLIRFRPRQVWGKVAAVTQPFVRNNPSLAYQIFCVKKLN